jgi:hypothetical protein
VVSLLAAGGDEARSAGGQSLVPLLNLRLVRPRLAVDLGRLRGLDASDAGRSFPAPTPGRSSVPRAPSGRSCSPSPVIGSRRRRRISTPATARSRCSASG